MTTRWSVVLTARDKASAESARALETLCQTYWYPLYAFVRASGRSPHDAQDLTQEFFAQLLAKEYLKAIEPNKGRFRTFLRTALKRFLANQWDRANAQKRGGGRVFLALDTDLGERLFERDQGAGGAPDRVYERRWALALLDQTMHRLEEEYAGKEAEWRQLKPHLTADRGAVPYAEIAAALQTTEGAARVAMHRLRRRFREVFRAAIADTVSSAAEVESEMRHVVDVLGRG